MKISKFAATSVLAIAAMGVTFGTANAVPVPAAPPQPSVAASATQQGVGWTVTRDGNKVIVKTVSGSLTNENNHLVVRNTAGRIVESVPLAVAVDGQVHPVSAQINGNTATLTTNTDPAAAHPVSKYAGLHEVDLNTAVNGVKDPIGLTASIGGFLGAASGLVGGCLLGAAAGAAISAPAALLFGAGPLAGCAGGALLVGTTAGLAGTATGGIGSALANAPQFMTLLNQPAKK